MKNNIILLLSVCFGLMVSCTKPNPKHTDYNCTNSRAASIDSVLNSIHAYTEQGNAGKQKEALESIGNEVRGFRDGTKEERKIYARFLRTKLIYYAQYTTEFDSMFHYATTAKEYAIREKDYEGAVISMANFGDILRQKGEVLKAISEYDQSLRLNDSIVKSPEMYLAIYSGMACSYVVLRNLNTAESWAKKMETLSEHMTTIDSISYYEMLGNCYYYGKRYDDCLAQFSALDKMLEGHKERTFDREVCNVNLADIYIQTKQDHKVGDLLDGAIDYFTENGIKAFLPYIHTLQIQHLLNTGKYKEAIVMARDVEDETKSMNPDHKITRLAVMATCMERNGDYKEALRYNTLHCQLEDSIRNSQVKIMTEEIENRYLHDVQTAEHELKVKNSKLREIYLWFIVLALFLTITLMGLYLCIRIRRAKAENEKALNKILNLRNEIVHNRITPHFISNALALGSKLTQEDIEDITSLIRNGLAYEHKLAVDFQKEYNLVCRYVKVASRINSNHIRFSANISPAIDNKKIMLPSMSLMIIVENAIKHGRKDENGTLDITLNLYKEEKRILLEIKNDGCLSNYNSNRGDSAMHGLRMLHQTIEMTNTYIKTQHIKYELKEEPEGKVCATFEITQ